MPNDIWQEKLLLVCRAMQWMLLMGHGQRLLASRLLAEDCGMVGFDIEQYSAIYFPIRTIKRLPKFIVRRVFADENLVDLHVEFKSASSAGRMIQIQFRFRHTQISKVHFSQLEELSRSEMERKQCELDLDTVVFHLGLTDA